MMMLLLLVFAHLILIEEGLGLGSYSSGRDEGGAANTGVAAATSGDSCGCSSLSRDKGIIEGNSGSGEQGFYDGGKDGYCKSDSLLLSSCTSDVNIANDSGSNVNKFHQDMILVSGGTYFIGTNSPFILPDGEGPEREVYLDPFLLDRFEVSNAEYRAFVEDSGYRTESEKFGWSFVFHSAIAPEIRKDIAQAVLGAEWWLPVTGAYWREPEGPGSDVFIGGSSGEDRSNHPAVHISWDDAKAFCSWRNGSRLPTEAEWEVAARGVAPEERNEEQEEEVRKKSDSGLKKRYLYPWGDTFVENGTYRSNTFQGSFPSSNTKGDGFEFLSPVDAFPPQNGLGFHNMIGNAWEWVEDWFARDHDSSRQINPRGPVSQPPDNNKVKKGGSFLCHKRYCYRYRTAARYYSTPDSAALNTGLRCAKSYA